MDNELREILKQLMDGQNRLLHDQSELRDNQKKFAVEQSKLAAGQNKLMIEQNKFAAGQSKLEDEVRKNSFKLETMEKKIDIIAEVQIAHKEQNSRQFEETGDLIVEKTDLLETAVKHVSKSVNETKESIDVLKEMTGKHEVDINILKRRPV